MKTKKKVKKQLRHDPKYFRRTMIQMMNEWYLKGYHPGYVGRVVVDWLDSYDEYQYGD